ncbi:APC family permease [Thermogymnomonas acidicola]|uniref:APC family permease n=1 Tax=Thermogymnomonas acidicola TaxID=399579 RepID=UPI00166B9CC0|nr:APC family permease [Thermogymnomonas acidicola]
MAASQENISNRLKKDQLGLWHGIFQSFSHVAPAAEVAILITGTALVAEGSTPLVFLLAPLIVLLWLNTNYQFSKKVASAGGYSAFARAGLGKVTGDMTGWLFFFNEFLTYTGFALLSFAAFVYLLTPSITSVTYIWIPITLIPLLFSTVFVYRGVRLSLNYAAYTGFIETAVLTISAVIIIFRLGHANTLSVFTASPVHNDLSLIGLGLLFGLYSYGGTGSVVALGEETKQPNTTIRKAIIYGWLLVVIPLALNAYALTVGWGLNNISSFGNSPDPGVIEYFKYLGPFGGWIFVAVVLNSFFDFGIAINNSLTRMLYYLSRDSNILPKVISRVHPKYGTPYVAILAVAVLSFIISVVSGLIFGPFVGALVIEGAASIAFMLQHALATLSLPFFSRKERMMNITMHVIIPALALGFIGFAIFSTIYPVPAYPLNLPAYMVVAWIIIGLAVVYSLSKKNKSISL